jgi:hypothetical protein
MGLEQDPLSLVRTTEELLGGENGGSGLENREYGRKNPLCWPRNTLYPKKIGTNVACGRSVAIVRWRTQAKEFVLFLYPYYDYGL